MLYDQNKRYVMHDFEILTCDAIMKLFILAKAQALFQKGRIRKKINHDISLMMQVVKGFSHNHNLREKHRG